MFNSWFISPWQAARIAVDVQHVLAINWLRFAAGGIGARSVAPRVNAQSVARRIGGQPVAHYIVDQSASHKAPSVDDESALLKATKSEVSKRPQTAAARRATRVKKTRGRPNTKKSGRRASASQGGQAARRKSLD
jgi:hypothetical protein